MTAEPPATLDLVTDDRWPAEIAGMEHGFAGKLNVYRLMAHHPALLAAWESLRNHVVLGNALPPRLQELAILRTGYRWGSAYELAHHVVRGRQAGLSDAEIDWARADAARWPAACHETLVLRSVDQLLDAGKLDDATRDALVATLGAPALFDLMATVGIYTTLAFVTNSFDPPIEPEIAAQFRGDAARREDDA